jgi:SOS-response transcriptional repressor LexA
VDIDSLGIKPTRQTFALRVVGDSMIGKHIWTETSLCSSTEAEPRSGQIVCRFDRSQEHTEKFVLKKWPAPFLKAENPKIS